MSNIVKNERKIYSVNTCHHGMLANQITASEHLTFRKACTVYNLKPIYNSIFKDSLNVGLFISLARIVFFGDELHDLTQKMRNAQLSKFHEFPVDSLQKGLDMIDSSIQKAREVSDTTAWVDGYQTIVASCVSCHETYCPGPINKINSLAK